jgi:hypothetical protein
MAGVESVALLSSPSITLFHEKVKLGHGSFSPFSKNCFNTFGHCGSDIKRKRKFQRKVNFQYAFQG